MYFNEQQIGSSDVGIMEMVISRTIVAKMLAEYGVLPDNYSFYDSKYLTEGYNYETTFSFQSRIDTLNEALELLKLGTAKCGETEDGIFIHLEIPGLELLEYDSFFDNEQNGYDWQADGFLAENEEALEAVNNKDSFYVKFTDFTMLPHQILKNILNEL